MGAAMKRFWDWANQPVSFGKKKPQPFDAMPVLDLPDNITALDLNLDHVNSANDEAELSPPPAPVEPATPDDYLGQSAQEVVDGLERFLHAHAITEASELSWVHLLDEMKVIQLKRMRLTELENECIKIKAELQECKRNLATQVKRASTEESLTILMHEKRLELAKAVGKRIDAL